MGQLEEFRDVERLGAELAAEALRLEPGVDVGLGPLVAPDAIEVKRDRIARQAELIVLDLFDDEIGRRGSLHERLLVDPGYSPIARD